MENRLPDTDNFKKNDMGINADWPPENYRYTGYLLMNDENIITLNKVLHVTFTPQVIPFYNPV